MWKYLLLAGSILFISVASVLERVTPDYDWRQNYISELSLGKFGAVQRTSFVVSGLLIISLTLYLVTISRTKLLKAGWLAGALVGLSLVSAGIWNTDVRELTRTTAGIIHEWGYWFGMIGATLACLLAAMGNWRNKIILAYSVAKAAFATYMIAYGWHWFDPGIYQRLLLYSLLMWVEIVAAWTMWRS
jgi:hypothetical membrane protein